LPVAAGGGHRQLPPARDHDRRCRGEAFDKSAKLLGLGFPGGPAVERAAASGNPAAVPLPRPLVGSAEPHFSFAGLKSAVLRAPRCGDAQPEDIAASFQQAVVDCLIDRTARALRTAPAVTALGGGRRRGGERAHPGGAHRSGGSAGLPFVAPPLWLCTDNAAMIAWAGALRFDAGLVDGLDAPARARWPLDPAPKRPAAPG
jgi:N6-L-threonylcarbamoyladenine synthase